MGSSTEREVFHGKEPRKLYRAEVGMPIGYFYGYKTAGVFQESG